MKTKEELYLIYLDKLDKAMRMYRVHTPAYEAACTKAWNDYCRAVDAIGDPSYLEHIHD